MGVWLLWTCAYRYGVPTFGTELSWTAIAIRRQKNNDDTRDPRENQPIRTNLIGTNSELRGWCLEKVTLCDAEYDFHMHSDSHTRRSIKIGSVGATRRRVDMVVVVLSTASWRRVPQRQWC